MSIFTLSEEYIGLKLTWSTVVFLSGTPSGVFTPSPKSFRFNKDFPGSPKPYVLVLFQRV